MFKNSTQVIKRACWYRVVTKNASLLKIETNKFVTSVFTIQIWKQFNSGQSLRLQLD